jgi:site-specific DNA recombinase
LRPET